MMTRLNAAITHCRIERKRNRSGRCVGVPIHGNDHSRRINTKASTGGGNDANIGLMRNQPVDLGKGHAGFIDHFATYRIEHRHGKLEDRLAIHGEKWVTNDLPARHGTSRAKHVRMTGIRVQGAGQNAGPGISH
jgi:hypothetical protein